MKQHDRIYLVDDPRMGQRCWCEDSQFPEDVVYLRATPEREAAPELLAALKDCIDIMLRANGETLPITQGGHCEERDWVTALRTARAAIEKAEGRGA